MDWGNLVSGLIGAVVGGIATLVGAKWQLSSAEKGQEEREDRHHAAILRAIHDELETLWEQYLLTVGNAILALPANQPFRAYWPVSNDYFVVFNSNAVFIGHLRDDDLRKSLIVAYSRAKGLIDSFRLNNGLVERFENAHSIALQNPTPATQNIAGSHLSVLTQYAGVLKQGHTMLETSVNDALRRLRKAGVLAQNGN